MVVKLLSVLVIGIMISHGDYKEKYLKYKARYRKLKDVVYEMANQKRCDYANDCKCKCKCCEQKRGKSVVSPRHDKQVTSYHGKSVMSPHYDKQVTSYHGKSAVSQNCNKEATHNSNSHSVTDSDNLDFIEENDVADNDDECIVPKWYKVSRKDADK